MDLTLLSLNIKVFEFSLSVSLSLTHCLSRLCFSSPYFSVNIKACISLSCFKRNLRRYLSENNNLSSNLDGCV